MRAEINVETCQGIGMCELHAPEVFEVTNRGYATVLAAEIPPDQVEAVRLAAAKCPTDSILITP